MVDKNLFLYDLAIVAIMKNEGRYLKEWLDYHLLAGVDHFHIYDNESPDNQAEVAKPYVKAGLVDYIHAPGKCMQMRVYNEAVKRFKFQCRYVAFIDGDEFIYPKTHQSIIEVVDKILSRYPNAAGLSINWQCFGSNGQDKADYSRGVLERFTRRAPNDWAPNGYGNAHVKTIVNPRAINVVHNSHNANYFDPKYSVNENSKVVFSFFSLPVTTKTIVVNHYYTKSFEEYSTVKRPRGDVSKNDANAYPDAAFKRADRNEEFDDGILKYRAERKKAFKLPDNSYAVERLLNALMINLSPTLLPTTPPSFYKGKTETFLTCRAVASYLKTKLTDDTPAKFFEEAALKALLKSINGMNLTDTRLFLRELPDLLSLTYPNVKDLRVAALYIIKQLMDFVHLNNLWKDYVELEYLHRLLQTWKPQ